jgi:flagellar basal body-associated protein FliL
MAKKRKYRLYAYVDYEIGELLDEVPEHRSRIVNSILRNAYEEGILQELVSYLKQMEDPIKAILSKHSSKENTGKENVKESAKSLLNMIDVKG